MWRLSKKRLLIYVLLLICANTFMFRVSEELFKWNTSPNYNLVYVNSLKHVEQYMNTAFRKIRNPIVMTLKGRFIFNESLSKQAIALLNGTGFATISIVSNNSIFEISTASTKINKNKEIKDDVYFRDMLDFHRQVLNQVSDEEILQEYKKYFKKRQLFSNVLSIDKDRELISTLFPNPLEKDDRLLEQSLLKLDQVNNTPKIILHYYTKNIYNLQKKFEKKNCNIKNCLFTNRRKFLEEADAILFEKRVRSIPKSKKKDQILIYTSLESGSNNLEVQYGDRLANWSVTYRSDSVIATPYGKFIPYPNTTNFPTKIIENFAINKKRKVAWFVSNCHASNNRLQYARELKKYIEVDIYGDCGDEVCEKQEQSLCDQHIANNYKFFLSFENSLCKDYLSEKLFHRAFKTNLVPIVMGAHPDEYKRIAPPRSYIHVDMFESPKQLAEYLRFLDENDAFYNEYFLWKQTGEFVDTSIECRLCAMLHLAPHFPMWYSDSNEWWKSGKVCLSGRKNETNWKNIKPENRFQEFVKYGYKKDFSVRKKFSI